MTTVLDRDDMTSPDVAGLARERWRRIGWTVTCAAIVLGAGLPWLISGYQLSQVSGALYLSLGVLSMNLLTGLNGQISLGQSAFVGIGAYAVAILVTDHGWSYPAAMAAGVVLSAGAGVIVALPALRLRGLYVALTTFGIGLVFPSLIQKFADTTGGTAGKTIFPLYAAPEAFGLTTGEWAYLVTLVVLLVCLLFVHLLKASSAGRQIQAVRDADVVAEGFGVPLARIKVATFAASAAIAGLAGGLFAIQRQFVSPGDLSLDTSINFFVGMAIGGSVSVPGAVVGGFFLQYAPQLTQHLGIAPIYTPAIYGGLLIVIIRFARGGAAGLVRSAIEATTRR
ncbi:branched-chain amino acid ABC transporter permease [Nocardioides sp. Iso805N]|uniref:branched-chain amino acid ABC transporter permease n=1 Tax=Nocardioides sp. Iso805N TaxID=1283287 RepID=UPI000364E4B8|nr:branched-chain amino acid ABC transporter permease [Nocardioides sp. Iso805N]